MGCCCSRGPNAPYGVLTEENQNSNSADSTIIISQEEREHCTLIIPPRLLNEENSNSILNRKNSPWTASTCSQTNGIKFEFNLNNIEELVKFVKKVINSQHKTKSKKTQTASKEFDQSEFEAFKRLVGDDFPKAFTVINSNSSKVVVSTTQSPDLSDVKEKLNYLRKDEMTLNPEQMTQLMTTFNQNLYLPTAFVVPVPNENKVTIYSFDYNALTAAKHHIGVQSGKVKLTARERTAEQERNIPEESAKTDHTHLASTHLAREHATSFTTESGILVSVYKADITQLTVDAIVNAANEHLKHGGGVAAAIAKAAGVEMEIEGEEHVTTYGPLKVTDVVPTTAGKLPCRIVLHAVGPRWNDYQDKRVCQKHLEQTVFNCLKKGHELEVTSIAVTSISSAIFGVPKELCARMYLAALQRFEREYGSKSEVRHIHFVDISDEMVSIIQDTFSHHWICDVTLQETDKQVVSLGHLLPVDGEVTPAANSSHQPRTYQDLDLVLKLHAYDEKNIPIDLIYYCDEQCASLQSEGETPEDSICVASKPFSCLDLHKARWNLESENLETLTTEEGACLLFPATSHCLANKENVYDVTKTVISQMDQEKEQRRALNVIIVPCKAGAAASSTNVDIGANDFAAEMYAAYAVMCSKQAAARSKSL